jgi:ABC-type spermidine/putrescine transport system permease subunit II
MSENIATNLIGLSGLAAHLIWILPFGLLIMFENFNRFDHRLEEAPVILARRPGRHFGMGSCPLFCPLLSASDYSVSPCLGMRLPAQA